MKDKSRCYSHIAACSILSSLAFAWPAAAEEDAIATDRPDFVESGSVVGRGVFQIETSVAHERDRRSGTTTRTWTTPTLLRFGVSEDTELRIESDAFTRQTLTDPTGTSKQSGFSDTSLGVKWKISDGDDAAGKPAMALLAHIELNSGAKALRGTGAVPSLRLVGEWELADDASFGVMPGIVWQKDDAGNRYWSGIFAATYSRPLAGALCGFIELAGRELQRARYGGSQVTVDSGLVFALDRDTQLDAAINIGVNRFTPDFLVTVGFSKRFR